MGNENRNNTSRYRCSRAHKEVIGKTHGKNPWGNQSLINIDELQKIAVVHIRNCSCVAENVVSLSCGELLGHDLEDPGGHRKTGENRGIITIIITIIIIILAFI